MSQQKKHWINKEIEWILINKVKFIGEDEHTYSGYPQELIDGISEVLRAKIAKKLPSGEQLHIYYLEAITHLHRDNFNVHADKSYADLNEEQKFISEHISKQVKEKLL